MRFSLYIIAALGYPSTSSTPCNPPVERRKGIPILIGTVPTGRCSWGSQPRSYHVVRTSTEPSPTDAQAEKANVRKPCPRRSTARAVGLVSQPQQPIAPALCSKGWTHIQWGLICSASRSDSIFRKLVTNPPLSLPDRGCIEGWRLWPFNQDKV